MRATSETESGLDVEYAARCPTSRSMFERARQIFPSGVTSDNRYFQPFPLYVARAQGARKWDVDNNEYVDYWMGHGALLLGHGRQEVVEAVHRQVIRGTHFGACHELELAWGTLVVEMVPSAERVRFFSSGTEATMMAMRLARAYTGKPTIVTFRGHYYGWHDYAIKALSGSHASMALAGVPDLTLASVAVARQDDLGSLESVVSGQDVAGVIIEPSGARAGMVPVQPGFLRDLRRLCSENGIVLIFDEVVTGFRMAPGGAQQFYGVLPDLTCLGKMLAGGLPGGALAGKKEILGLCEFRNNPAWNAENRVPQLGTFNANPLSAAAGVAALSIARTGEPQSRAAQLASRLRREMNEVIAGLDLAGCVYGESSWFRILVGVECTARDVCDRHQCTMDADRLIGCMSGRAALLRKALLLEGVDLNQERGMVSSAHTEADVDQTVAAFGNALKRLQREFETHAE